MVRELFASICSRKSKFGPNVSSFGSAQELASSNHVKEVEEKVKFIPLFHSSFPLICLASVFKQFILIRKQCLINFFQIMKKNRLDYFIYASFVEYICEIR